MSHHPASRIARRPSPTKRVKPVEVADSGKPLSPGWWAARLLTKLVAQAAEADYWWDWYEGKHPLPWLHDLELIAQFDRLQRIARTNYVGLVVDAVEERLDIEGFRYGDSQTADERAWEIWQANDLDELSQIANLAALVTNRAYTLVWPSKGEHPDVWVEDGVNVTHEQDPATRRVLAAVKAWHDDVHDVDRAELYLPDGIIRYARPNVSSKFEVDHGHADGAAVELPDEFRELNPAGLVPVTPIFARPGRRQGIYRSELDDIIDIQDRINQTTFDRLVGSHYSAFQQVVAIGVEPEFDEETGQPINPFKRNAGQAWLIPPSEDGAAVSIDVIDPANLSTAIEAVEQDVTAMARVSRTPPYYLEARGQFPSGDAIRSAEAGLVKKAKRRTRQLDTGYEHSVRLSAAADGDIENARQPLVSTVWADVAIRTEGELVDSLVKMRTLDIPLEALWERWGASQHEISRWRQNADARRVLDLLVEPRNPAPDSAA